MAGSGNQVVTWLCTSSCVHGVSPGSARPMCSVSVHADTPVSGSTGANRDTKVTIPPAYFIYLFL